MNWINFCLIIIVVICSCAIVYLVSDLDYTIKECDSITFNSTSFNDCLAHNGWAPFGYGYE